MANNKNKKKIIIIFVNQLNHILKYYYNTWLIYVIDSFLFTLEYMKFSLFILLAFCFFYIYIYIFLYEIVEPPTMNTIILLDYIDLNKKN